MRHLVEVDGRKVSTVTRRLASISVAHQAADDTVDPPTRSLVVRKMLKALKSNHGSRPTKKAPVRTEALRRMVAALPDDLKGCRDRALLTLGFATACRRSELAALDVDDVEETDKSPSPCSSVDRRPTRSVKAGRLPSSTEPIPTAAQSARFAPGSPRPASTPVHSSSRCAEVAASKVDASPTGMSLGS
jgi:integrase